MRSAQNGSHVVKKVFQDCITLNMIFEASKDNRSGDIIPDASKARSREIYLTVMSKQERIGEGARSYSL